MPSRQITRLETKSGHMASVIRGASHLIGQPVTCILGMSVRIRGKRLIFFLKVLPAVQTLAGIFMKGHMIIRAVAHRVWLNLLLNTATPKAVARSRVVMSIEVPCPSGMASIFTAIIAQARFG